MSKESLVEFAEGWINDQSMTPREYADLIERLIRRLDEIDPTKTARREWEGNE